MMKRPYTMSLAPLAVLPLVGCALLFSYPTAKVTIPTVDPDYPGDVYEVTAPSGSGPVADAVLSLALGKNEEAWQTVRDVESEAAVVLFIQGLCAELNGELVRARDLYESAYRAGQAVEAEACYKRAKALAGGEG